MDIIHAWINDPIHGLILIVTLVFGSITGYYAHCDRDACQNKNPWLDYLRYFIGSVFSGICAFFVADSFEWPEKMSFLLYAYGCYMGPYMAEQLKNLVSASLTKNTQWRSKDK